MKKKLDVKAKIEKEKSEIPIEEKDAVETAKEVFEIEPKNELCEQMEDILDSIDGKVKKIDEISQVHEILAFLNERLNSKRYSELTGEWLSRAALKLSILNINIGIKASESSMSANMGYGYRKFQYASEWKTTKEKIAMHFQKVTNEDVKSELEVKNWIHFKNEMEEKLLADKLIAINQGIDHLLVSIGYRLKMLTQERMTAKYQS